MEKRISEIIRSRVVKVSDSNLTYFDGITTIEDCAKAIAKEIIKPVRELTYEDIITLLTSDYAPVTNAEPAEAIVKLQLEEKIK